MKLALLTFRYTAETHSGDASGPDALLRAGLTSLLSNQGVDVLGAEHTELTPDEEEAYGAWHRIGLANARLADLVAGALREQRFPVILESNCYAALGVLSGIQAAFRNSSPAAIGMVWIDAHGDFNTPETTLSGMLSGMPVAIATGMCLHRLRNRAQLAHPIDPENVLMVCVRANDPLEQELITKAGIETVPVSDIGQDCSRLMSAISRLSERVDYIYVHFDIDALDPSELANSRLVAPDGPTKTEMASALRLVMSNQKIVAFGVSDINPERDVEGQIIASALAVIQGAADGLLRRSGERGP